ncbi:MBL fold metallo-hydrolase [Candidatus Woesearchaeota archaeon]|nr:MBL fold metallo-hydrolase [Candidatus Woesearchaeota archaeon]
MRKKIMILLILIAVLSITSCKNNNMSIGNVKVEYTGEAAGFKLVSENKIVYIDPYKLPAVVEQKADQIYITHSHFDSCSAKDIAKVVKPTTWIIAPLDCLQKVADLQFGKVVNLDLGYTYNMDGITVDTIHAYNVNNNFHPYNNRWFGYVLKIDGKRIYYSGFTDYAPEMQQLLPVDMAVLVINGVDSMNNEDAVKVVKQLQPKKVIGVSYSSASSFVNIGGFKKDCQCDAEIV